MIAALNPCGFAMLPGYLALVARGRGVGPTASVLRAVAASVVMAIGFAVVFGGFGLLAITVADLVQQALPVATLLIGVALVVLGVRQLLGRSLSVRTRLPGRGRPSARLGSMFGYGVVYALVSLSCTVAPFLAVTGIGVAGRNWLGPFVAYVAGFTALVGVLAVIAAVTGAVAARGLHRHARQVQRAAGVLLVLTGLYVAYYGGYELRMRGMIGPDPVIAVAGRIQGALAGWVYRWPGYIGTVALLLAAITVVAAVLVLVRKNKVRNTVSEHRASDD
jgi:cytochrome c biogenesis protein CcdA